MCSSVLAVPSFAAMASILVTVLVLGVFIPVVQATTGAATAVRDRVVVNVFMNTRATQDDLAGVKAHLAGPASAQRVALVPLGAPHRDGGQAQYIDTPLPVEADTLEPLLEWMVEHVAEDLSVPDLAARALMSERTFARRFRAETGTTPAAWLTRQRVLRAQELLEGTDAPVEDVARQCGFGTA
ncbi:helix-turn-helix domain-containing protein, partial [Staphylococcus haemolyticus]|uniref:helix-turn-helix domain-containing protein n=1 Tax=Staphylococcus haemolyticus TaxID=1283 RepID=UPI001C5C9557